MSEPGQSDPDASPAPEDWLVLPSAAQHGVADEDMTHAIDHHLRVWAQDDGTDMFVGPSRTGALLEVGHITWFGIDAIVHAMPAREKYLRGEHDAD